MIFIALIASFGITIVLAASTVVLAYYNLARFEPDQYIFVVGAAEHEEHAHEA